MFFEATKSGVSVKEESLLIPEVRELYDGDKTKGKRDFHKAIAYVYHMYDKRSDYIETLFDDRVKLVSKDQLDSEKYYIKAEKNEKIRAVIDKLELLQYSKKERLLQGAQSKIQEYLKFWRDTQIKEGNHKLVKETLEGSETLLKLLDRLEKQVYDEKSQKSVGGGEATMFENG